MYCYLDGFPGWQKAGYPVETIEGFLPAVKIPTVAPAELKALLDRKQALVLDIRDNEDLKAGRIKGGLFIPLEKLMAQYERIPKDIPIVITDLHGAQGPIAGRYLVKQQFSKVSRLEGGFSAWAEAGLPTEK